MSGQLVRTERSGSVLRVTIERAEKRNALSNAVVAALGDAFRENAGDPGLSLAVLSSAGDKSFAAGGDLHELASVRSADGARAFATDTRAAFDVIRRFPVPVVAAMNGDALGGGAELALACDLRIAAAHARIGYFQGRLNIATAWGGGIDLMRVLGTGRALDLLCSSRPVPMDEALRIGLVGAVASPDQPFAAFVDAFVARFAHQRPQVMRAFKAQALAERLGLPRAERELIELDHFVTTWVHDDHWAAADATLANLRR